jgi:hypothetical protein
VISTRSFSSTSMVGLDMVGAILTIGSSGKILALGKWASRGFLIPSCVGMHSTPIRILRTWIASAGETLAAYTATATARRIFSANELESFILRLVGSGDPEDDTRYVSHSGTDNSRQSRNEMRLSVRRLPRVKEIGKVSGGRGESAVMIDSALTKV